MVTGLAFRPRYAKIARVMQGLFRFLKYAVTAFAVNLSIFSIAGADEAELEALFEGLKTADESAATQIEQRIYEIWSKSGSEAMDLLLDRGRTALNDGDATLAVEHFSALIDHAPGFAEGYNARATAFFQKGQYGLSLNDIRQTLALNPRHFGAISGLALILEEMGQQDDAYAAWKEVEKLNPHQRGLDEALLRLERFVEGETL